MARQMARFIGVVFGFVAVVLLQCAEAQTVHVVGDSTGWTVPSGGAAFYTNWASGKTFVIGDILTFNFATFSHDVVRLPKASFDSCSSSNAIGDIITTGPVNITLEAAGEHYYICTIGQHCVGGQKLAINVSSTPGASPPTTTPNPAPPTTPAAPSPTTSVDCPTPTESPTASITPGPQGGANAPPPSGSSKVLASLFVTVFATIMGLLL